jgi:multicomponent Na+:H+ antiporter subunit A
VTVFSGGEPLPEDDTLGVVDFAEMAEAAFGPIYSLNPDPLYLLIWREIRDGAAGARRFMTTRIERAPVLTAVVCAAVLLLAAAVR